MDFDGSVAKSVAAFTITGMIVSLSPAYDDEGHVHAHPVHGEHPIPQPGPPVHYTTAAASTSNVDASVIIPMSLDGQTSWHVTFNQNSS